MRLALPATSLLLLFSSVSAMADTSYPVGGSGGGVSGSGILYTTEDQGVYTITDITGDGVTGLLPVNSYMGNDNLLFPGQTPALDGHGFGFTDSMGDTGYQVDLFYSADAGAYEAWVLDTDGVGTDQPIPVTFSLGPATTPQPSPEFAGVRRLAALPQGTEAFAFSFEGAAAQTPEPTSVALLGTGLLGMAGMLRRRKK